MFFLFHFHQTYSKSIYLFIYFYLFIFIYLFLFICFFILKTYLLCPLWGLFHIFIDVNKATFFVFFALQIRQWQPLWSKKRKELSKVSAILIYKEYINYFGSKKPQTTMETYAALIFWFMLSFLSLNKFFVWDSKFGLQFKSSQYPFIEIVSNLWNILQGLFHLEAIFVEKERKKRKRFHVISLILHNMTSDVVSSNDPIF